MRIFFEEYEHPTQVSRVRLNVFEEPGGRYLVTEDRTGTTTVVSTLGLFERREAALERVADRRQQLARQRYRPIVPAA